MFAALRLCRNAALLPSITYYSPAMSLIHHRHHHLATYPPTAANRAEQEDLGWACGDWHD